MAIITITDIYTRLYAEIVNEITREETTLVDTAIAAAEAEAKMFLSRYDLLQLFGNDTTEPTITDTWLKSVVVEIACWQLVKLGHPSIDYKTTRDTYDAAIASLKNIQSGKAQPEGWPLRDTTGSTTPTGSYVAASYQQKRKNNW